MAGTTPTSLLANLAYGFATEADDAGLRQLLRETPMPGPIQVSFEREPSYFGAVRSEGGRHHTICARDNASGRIFAMASRSVRELYVNGQPRRVGYLSQLRIAPGYRHLSRALLRRGFALLRETRQADETPFDITTVVTGNEAARRVLEAGLMGVPRYTPVGRILTMLFRPSVIPSLRGIPGFRSGGDSTRSSQARDDRYQFSPVEPVPAIWDQRAFKQIVVRGYAPWLRWCRWWLRLPPVGSVLPVAYLTGKPDAVPADCRWLVLGLSDRHPLLQELRRRFRPRVYESTLYVVHEKGTMVQVDDRIPHVEVALL